MAFPRGADQLRVKKIRWLMPTVSPKSPYRVHPGVAMVENWIKELPEKTGRSRPTSGLKARAQWKPSLEKEGASVPPQAQLVVVFQPQVRDQFLALQVPQSVLQLH
jgi:hypothetical protein